jgi:hypothetical protein
MPDDDRASFMSNPAHALPTVTKRESKFMRKTALRIAKPAAVATTPAPKKAARHVRSTPKTETRITEPKKKDKNFSQSRDTREDRSARQMKTSKNSQTLARGR